MELQVIQNKIYEIRGYRVMIDFDLAVIYQVGTRVLKQAVRRNIERFPEDFMFELTKTEYDSLRSQFVILNEDGDTGGRGKHSKYLPFVFSEGVAMLSSVLRSDTAIKMNISIMRAFVATRQLILNTPISETQQLQNEVRELKAYIEEVFADYNDINEETRMQLELINGTLAELQAKNKTLNKPHKPVGYIKPE